MRGPLSFTTRRHTPTAPRRSNAATQITKRARRIPDKPWNIHSGHICTRKRLNQSRRTPMVWPYLGTMTSPLWRMNYGEREAAQKDPQRRIGSMPPNNYDREGNLVGAVLGHE